MNSETYTPGHTQNASDFMAQRTLETHGTFFLPYLETGVSVLDCGCGPGTITMGIAAHCAPGEVIGIDFAQSQIDRARASATERRLRNVTFETGSIYALPFDNDQFDRVFSHALMEHLSKPVPAIRELYRVLKPGGVIGVSSPDWGGFILSPPSPALSQAIDSYMAVQTQNGGDILVGRKLGVLLAEAGFNTEPMAARYECYPSLHFIGEYLALQLEDAGENEAAHVLRAWSHNQGGMFAQAWVSAIGGKPQ